MSSPMRLRPSRTPVDKRCEHCHDTGLVEKSNEDPAQYAHEAFLKMRPCTCPAGRDIRSAFESGRRDYEP